MPDSKKKHYEELMVRMKAAHDAKYYLEASWYAYAILEDRLLSLLSNSGGSHEKNRPSKSIRNFGRKLEILVERRKKDELLKAYFTDVFAAALKTWKNERNDLTHAMADASVPLGDVDKSAYLIAMNGQGYVTELSRIARLLKRNRSKASIPAKVFPY